MVRSSDGNDRQIALQIRSGAQEGFTALLRSYGGRVSGYLKQRFPSLDEHDVQEALADAMLTLSETFDAQRGSLGAWFLLLAHQRAVGMLRADGNRPGQELPGGDVDSVAVEASPLDDLVFREQQGQLMAAIESLSSLEQAVIRADIEEGGPVGAETLAQRCATTEGSIYAARRRARRKLLDRCGWLRERLGVDETT